MTGPLIMPSPRAPITDPKLVRPNWVGAPLRDPGKLWLDKNENTDPSLAAVVGSVVAGLGPATQYSYPDFGPLYEKLARYAGAAPENLVLAAGSDGVIRSCFEAYVEPGDVVVHTVPTFAMYPVYCRIYGARGLGVDYRPSAGGPVLDTDALIGTIRSARPKLVCLPNPDSPTGTVVEPERLHSIVAAAGDVGSLVLVDEAYYPFYNQTIVPWIAEYPNLVAARSTGKAWGMAGFRIGYAVASPDVATNLHKVRPMYETSTVACAVLDGMLDHVEAMQASVARLNRGKDEFLQAMQALGFRTLSGQGNFLHVAFGAQADAIHNGLSGIVYYRRDFDEPCLRGFSRFSATTSQLFEPVIRKIRSIAQKESLQS